MVNLKWENVPYFIIGEQTMELTTILYTKQFQELGRKIAYYRKIKQLSQTQLAACVGISSSYLSKIERADLDSLSLITLMQIAEALEVPAWTLLKFDDDPV